MSEEITWTTLKTISCFCFNFWEDFIVTHKIVSHVFGHSYTWNRTILTFREELVTNRSGWISSNSILSGIISDTTAITAIHIIIKDPLNFFAEHAVATDISWIITIEDMSKYTLKKFKWLEQLLFCRRKTCWCCNIVVLPFRDEWKRVRMYAKVTVTKFTHYNNLVFLQWKLNWKDPYRYCMIL